MLTHQIKTKVKIKIKIKIKREIPAEANNIGPQLSVIVMNSSTSQSIA